MSSQVLQSGVQDPREEGDDGLVLGKQLDQPDSRGAKTYKKIVGTTDHSACRPNVRDSLNKVGVNLAL